MHEVLIALQVDARRTREPRRAEPVQLLVEAAERVARGLRAAEVTVLGALGPEQLAETLRTAFDPYQRADLARLQTADPERHGLAEGSSWPAGASEAWDHYRCDGALHATYWIGGWPRLEVSPLFLSPLLGSSGAVRTVAVTFEPVPSARSTRDVEAAVTRDRADRELRARLGQSETARQRQARESTTRREAELAAGHGEVRFSGFITVSGRDSDELRRSCAEVSIRRRARIWSCIVSTASRATRSRSRCPWPAACDETLSCRAARPPLNHPPRPGAVPLPHPRRPGRSRGVHRPRVRRRRVLL